MEIRLQRHQLATGPWQQAGHLFFTGYAFWQNEKISLEKLSHQLDKVHSIHDFAVIVSSINGAFSLIYQKENRTLAAVDAARSMPLFYSDKIISDVLNSIDMASEIRKDTLEGLTEMEFVQGTDTYVDGWSQVEGGQCIWIESGKVNRAFHWDNRPIPSAEAEGGEREKLAELLDKMAERLVDSLDGKQAVIPLSGGYDSRLILAMLLSKNYTNIHCFTYGQREGYEAETASKIINQKNLAWTFIPYDDAAFSSMDWADFEAYCLYASNGVSVPQEQEFIALSYLKNNNVIDHDAVLIPGYCGDFHVGSYLPDDFYRKRWEKNPATIAAYLAHHFKNSEEAYKIETAVQGNFEVFYANLEAWLARERMAKYVVNGLRCYEFYGYGWRLPLWDTAFLAFWREQPLTNKKDKNLYVGVLEEVYFKPLNIHFQNEHFDSRFTSDSVATKLKYLLPPSVKKLVKQLIYPKMEVEINNLQRFSAVLQEQMKMDHPSEQLAVNEAMAMYIAFLMRKDI